MTNYKNIKVNNLYESMIRGGYAMQTGKPKCFPEDPQELKELAMERYNTSKKLGNAPSGSGHSNFLKGIGVSFDMKISHALLPQFQRYHFCEILSSQSKMHRLTRKDFDYHPYTLESQMIVVNNLIDLYNNFDKIACKVTNTLTLDSCTGCLIASETTIKHILTVTKQELFEVIVYNCPLGLQLWMGVDTNYLQLQTMVNQRHNHKLKEWHRFCDMCLDLPLFTELAYDKN